MEKYKSKDRKPLSKAQFKQFSLGSKRMAEVIVNDSSDLDSTFLRYMKRKINEIYDPCKRISGGQSRVSDINQICTSIDRFVTQLRSEAVHNPTLERLYFQLCDLTFETRFRFFDAFELDEKSPNKFYLTEVVMRSAYNKAGDFLEALYKSGELFDGKMISTKDHTELTTIFDQFKDHVIGCAEKSGDLTSFEIAVTEFECYPKWADEQFKAVVVTEVLSILDVIDGVEDAKILVSEIELNPATELDYLRKVQLFESTRKSKQRKIKRNDYIDPNKLVRANSLSRKLDRELREFSDLEKWKIRQYVLVECVEFINRVWVRLASENKGLFIDKVKQYLSNENRASIYVKVLADTLLLAVASELMKDLRENPNIDQVLANFHESKNKFNHRCLESVVIQFFASVFRSGFKLTQKQIMDDERAKSIIQSSIQDICLPDSANFSVETESGTSLFDDAQKAVESFIEHLEEIDLNTSKVRITMPNPRASETAEPEVQKPLAQTRPPKVKPECELETVEVQANETEAVEQTEKREDMPVKETEGVPEVVVTLELEELAEDQPEVQNPLEPEFPDSEPEPEAEEIELQTDITQAVEELEQRGIILTQKREEEVGTTPDLEPNQLDISSESPLMATVLSSVVARRLEYQEQLDLHSIAEAALIMRKNILAEIVRHHEMRTISEEQISSFELTFLEIESEAAVLVEKIETYITDLSEMRGEVYSIVTPSEEVQPEDKPKLRSFLAVVEELNKCTQLAASLKERHNASHQEFIVVLRRLEDGERYVTSLRQRIGSYINPAKLLRKSEQYLLDVEGSSFGQLRDLWSSANRLVSDLMNQIEESAVANDDWISQLKAKGVMTLSKAPESKAIEVDADLEIVQNQDENSDSTLDDVESVEWEYDGETIKLSNHSYSAVLVLEALGRANSSHHGLLGRSALSLARFVVATFSDELEDIDVGELASKIEVDLLSIAQKVEAKVKLSHDQKKSTSKPIITFDPTWKNHGPSFHISEAFANHLFAQNRILNKKQECALKVALEKKKK